MQTTLENNNTQFCHTISSKLWEIAVFVIWQENVRFKAHKRLLHRAFEGGMAPESVHAYATMDTSS